MIILIIYFISYSAGRVILVDINLLSFNSFRLSISILIDKLASIFCIRVSLISLAVFSFRYDYIIIDKNFIRFHLILRWFVTSILFLIFSQNLFFTILGWDGLGLRSYLLVIYYGRDKSGNAGMLTIITNRLGDILVIFSLSSILSLGRLMFGSYSEIIKYEWVMLILFAGAITKSAQLPFRAWLPAAIAAPTPVSSLVHSSTLVTAGVYLILRHIEHIIQELYSLSRLLLLAGTITMTVASLSALFEKDIKKIIALSTLSQLGLIFCRLGITCYLITFLHLIIHAFFKAIIFISTGNIIHHRGRFQSLFKTGSILRRSPLNSSISLIASVNLIGAPFAAAFFSKEPIVEIILFYRGINNWLSLIILIRIFLTSLYSARFVRMVFLTFSKSEKIILVKENNYLIEKGVNTLFIPAFRRGAFVTTLFRERPRILFYPGLLKALIILLIVLGMVFLLTTNFFSIKNLEYSLFNIRRTPIISNKLLPLITHQVSLVNKNFGYFLINFSLSKLNLISSWLTLESKVFWQALSLVPAGILISFSIIYM